MDWNLTNPGLQYDQGQGMNQATGMPVQLPPIVKFFKNAALRGHQAALDEMSQVQPGTSSITGPDGSAPQIPEPGQADTTQVKDNAPPITPVPKFFKPTFAQTTQDSQGLPAPINDGQTKMGKLLRFLAGAGQGALAGWGQGSAGAGAQQAREVPIQMAQQRQQLQSGSLANTQAATNLSMTPLRFRQLNAEIENTLAQTRLATEGATGGQYQMDPAGTGYRFQPTGHFGQPVGPGMSAIPPYLLKPKVKGVTYAGEDGQARPGVQNLLTGEVTDEHGQTVPNAQVFESSMVPKTTTGSESTDLMGNTRSTHTTGPAQGSGRPQTRPLPMQQSPQGQRVPSPTNTGGGLSIAAPNMVQRIAGGPLARQTVSSAATRPSSKTSAPAQSSSTLANDPVYGLAPDVERRLQALAPPAAQGYLRSVLQYKGQLPSNRGRSAPQYAQDLDILSRIDPTFNAQNYDLIRGTKAAYAPGGRIGQQVLGFNTALRHMGMLNDAAAALNNGNVQLANKIGNAISVQFGNDAVTNFNTIKTYLGSELAKGFGGGVATDSSRAEAAPILSQIQSPKQLTGGFKTAADLLRGKIGAQESAYSQPPPLGTGQKVSLLDDESHGVLQKIGLEQPQMLTLQDGHGHKQQILALDWKKNKSAILQKDPGAKVIQ